MGNNGSMALVTTYRQTFSSEQLDIIRKTIAPNTSPEDFAFFIEVCKQTGLNPIARQIYAVVRNEWNKELKRSIPKMTIQTSIDGYRLLAQRSGKYAGQIGPQWCGKDKQWTEVWLEDEPPAAARVAVLRSDFKEPLWAVAKYESYVARGYNEATRKYDGAPLNLWAKMPELMIAKVAEALALRRAFPAELSGIYTKEEMDQAEHDAPMPTVTIRPSEHDSHAEMVEGELLDPSQSRQNGQEASSNDLESIPSVSRLKADVAALQIKNADGSLMSWQETLAHVFKKPIAEGKITLESLVEQDLGPDACKRIQQFVDAVKQARSKSKVA